MGGDDLASDDEFLTGNVVAEEDDSDSELETTKKSVLQASTVAVINDDDDNNRKRKNVKDDDASDDNDAIVTGNGSKKTKTDNNKEQQPKTASRHKLLLQAGRTIEEESTEKQASFLWTALVHYHKLQTGKDSTENTEEIVLQPKLQAHHFQKTSAVSTTNTMESRLRECIPSMKLLKSWKHRQSPMILIVCLSARRAVQVLGEIKSFKTRVAKLFAKHLSKEQQAEWLKETAFGIAVGTPHRLLALCEFRALSLAYTRAVVLDAHQDAKRFTVCTLPDTAPHCMQFLYQSVLPAMQERVKKRPKEPLKLAFC